MAIKIGLGLTTYKRPEYFQESLGAIQEHLLDRVDKIYVFTDDSLYNSLQQGYSYTGWDKRISFHHPRANGGVAKAKNWLLKRMMQDGCDWLFLAEDDIIVQHRGAIVQYIATAIRTGCHHLMFAHHGPGNAGGPVYVPVERDYEIFPACVGAWCLYTRKAIETVGYMDEKFHNAWEHVEHTARIGQAGLCPPFGSYMDAYHSQRYLAEIPGSIDSSSIRHTETWVRNMIKGLEYWKAKDPEHFPLQQQLDILLGKK